MGEKKVFIGCGNMEILVKLVRVILGERCREMLFDVGWGVKGDF